MRVSPGSARFQRALAGILAGVVCCYCITACSSVPSRSQHFSPPSVTPVRQKITDAQSHAALAKSRVAHASRVLPKASPPSAFDDLTIATQEIDALTAELLTAQTALNSLEKQTSDQTDSLNRANDDKNAALLDRDREKRLANKIAGQRNKLFLLLSAAVIWIFRTPLFALARAGLAIITKLPI